MITQLKDFKTEKKYKKILEDINTILRIFSLTQMSLSFFKEYVVVQEIISILETNKTMLEMHKRKYEAQLFEIEKKSTEQDKD